MGSNNLFPYMFQGEANSDLNEVTETGFYRLANTNFTNSPASALYGILIVHRDKTAYMSQIFISSNHGELWVRGGYFNSKSYPPWYRAENFGYNTLADLATALKPLLGLS